MKKILLDVDEVMCYSGFMAAVNAYLGENHELSEFKSYYIDDIIPENRRIDFYKYCTTINMYDNAKLVEDAVEVIKKLNEKYEIYICSSFVNPFFPEDAGKQLKDKYDYIYKNFPFLDPEKFIFTSVKSILKADIQIDDRITHLEGDSTVKILFPAYHNKEIRDKELLRKGIIRAGLDEKKAWREIEKILLENK